ncbi:hypothetical protein MDOR_10090 [Mycolicibacterium doricum]|uniref:Uncharacterized protein n=1 Tax=Mycolicibacterium doricum TaxID=126673 RepID=A0A1X1TBJ9_9MYCO|nr:AAA family ATPase [Mycolicibacterium doricum]ORV41954.1 hypothetical protein AWC01_08585 [Mycolicibacterium doricum]BBZ06840.1 hypothetical protein MDOR_10090 [Mycolicibacterium doricum]
MGDEHQLAPVKARGGMFAQLCDDLPWTQKLSEVWRMRDPEERTASLALRDGNPAEVARAVSWYRTHDRLHCGDAVTMAQDALAAYQTDLSKGHDALLICDTTEMARALNWRLHGQRIGRDEPTLTVANGEQVGVGDLIVSRRNDPDVTVIDNPQATESAPMVRNGNRWRVAAVDERNDRIAAVRLDDGVGAVFRGDYVREHINLGYAVTVHSAQGVTADTSHAILGENSTRNLLYVAMTRGRHTNTAHLYERTVENLPSLESVPLARGNSTEAAQLVRSLTARDDTPQTAHQIASQANLAAMPAIVAGFVSCRTDAIESRREAFGSWKAAIAQQNQGQDLARDRGISLSRGSDNGLDL